MIVCKDSARKEEGAVTCCARRELLDLSCGNQLSLHKYVCCRQTTPDETAREPSGPAPKGKLEPFLKGRGPNETTVALGRPSVVGRRSLAIAVPVAFSVLVFWFVTAGFHSSHNLIRALGAGVFLVLLTAGTFNLLLYLVGFSQEMALRDSDQVLTGKGSNESGEPCPVGVRTHTAIVMPIYHEDTIRVAAGIWQAWRSCKTCGLQLRQLRIRARIVSSW